MEVSKDYGAQWARHHELYSGSVKFNGAGKVAVLGIADHARNDKQRSFVVKN